MLENNYELATDPGSHSDRSTQNRIQQEVVKETSSEKRKAKYLRLIDSPELDELSPLQKEFLTGRWLDQMDWFSREAKFYQRWFYWVRLIIIVCSVLAPVFISFGSVWSVPANAPISNVANANVSNPADSPDLTDTAAISSPSASNNAQSQQITLANLARPAFHIGLFLSQVVAILAAVEQFFKFGDRWRHYRRTAEVLKSHGWQFFQLGGVYSTYAKSGRHKEAFPVFASQVEEIVQGDLEGFVSQIAVQKQLDVEGLALQSAKQRKFEQAESTLQDPH